MVMVGDSEEEAAQDEASLGCTPNLRGLKNLSEVDELIAMPHRRRTQCHSFPMEAEDRQTGDDHAGLRG